MSGKEINLPQDSSINVKQDIDNYLHVYSFCDILTGVIHIPDILFMTPILDKTEPLGWCRRQGRIKGRWKHSVKISLTKI